MDFASFIQILKEYGLPLALLVAGVSLIARRVFVTKAEMDEAIKHRDGEAVKSALQAKEEKDYVDQRRVEEREGRLRAEVTTDKSLELLKEQTSLIREIERELSRLTSGRIG